MFAKAFLAVALAGVALAQTFSINTPASIQQCQPAALSWVGGTAPFILDVIPGGQVGAAAIAQIADNVSGNSATWTVNVAQGTSITIRVRDSTGAIAYASQLTVQAGASGCLGAGASSGAASGAASGASSASGAASSGVGGIGASASSVSSAVSASRSSAAPTTSAAASSMSSMTSMMTSMSSTSRSTSAASSASAAAASSTGAGDLKASFNFPVLSIAAVGGFIALGGFATLF